MARHRSGLVPARLAAYDAHLPPIEVLWPAYPQQGVFRPEWSLDVVYFCPPTCPSGSQIFLVLPATQLTSVLGNAGLQEAVGSLPWLVQFLLYGPGGGYRRVLIRRALHGGAVAVALPAPFTIPRRRSTGCGSRAHLVTTS
jgi:hypothetical protein